MKSLTIEISIVVASLLVPTAGGVVPSLANRPVERAWKAAKKLPLRMAFLPVVAAVLLVACSNSASAQAFVNDNDGLLDVGEAPGFPADPMAVTGELALRNKRIQDLDGTSLLTNLQSLDLHFNAITSIEAGDFEGLTNLQYLWLSGNAITSIDAGGFEGLTNLQSLDLGYNLITSIEAGDFEGLTNLQSLVLGSNAITRIEAGGFEGLTNLQSLYLSFNDITSIEAGDFEGLTNLQWLSLSDNDITSIETGAFSGMPKLKTLLLGENSALTKLNLAEADFSSLTRFNVQLSVNINQVSLRNSVLNQTSLTTLMDGGSTSYEIGIGELRGITELDLSGIDFAEITDLSPLYRMDDLTDLWLAGTQNLDAFALDALLDELATIEGTDVEGILHMTRADFNAFNTAGGGLLAAWHAENGHHVSMIPEPATLVLLLLASTAALALRKL